MQPVIHPIGTVAMLPREMGGAVGSDLKVYGTSNVRVVGESTYLSSVLSLSTSDVTANAHNVCG